jgi:hypothetical protein
VKTNSETATLEKKIRRVGGPRARQLPRRFQCRGGTRPAPLGFQARTKCDRRSHPIRPP